MEKKELKKMKIYKILLTFCFLIFINCTTSTKDSFILKKEFYNNGNLKSVYFGDTLAEGKAYHFYPEGEKFTEINYFGSKINGAYKYYNKGKLILEEFYVNGKKDGISKNYSLDGSIFEEGEYKDDSEHGIWNYYHNNKLILTEFYEKGELKEIIFKDTIGYEKNKNLDKIN